MTDTDSKPDQGKPGAVDPVPRAVGSVLGLTAFATACGVGIAIGNPAIVILPRALLCMIVASIIGRLLGWAGNLAVREFVSQYREANPPPQMPEALRAIQRQNDRQEDIKEAMRSAA